tara:strand:+ start:1093 stop:1224 length:132 start_codon:yes stop_codon:yes gene_type:complete
MNELLIGVVGMVLLYCLGHFLYREPSHTPIQQELIKMEKDSED